MDKGSRTLQGEANRRVDQTEGGRVDGWKGGRVEGEGWKAGRVEGRQGKGKEGECNKCLKGISCSSVSQYDAGGATGLATSDIGGLSTTSEAGRYAEPSVLIIGLNSIN